MRESSFAHKTAERGPSAYPDPLQRYAELLVSLSHTMRSPAREVGDVSLPIELYHITKMKHLLISIFSPSDVRH